LKLRFRLVHFLLCAAFATVLGRLAYLQLWRHDDLLKRVNQQSQRWVKEAPSRGPILDREDRVLAESVRVGSCFADPNMIADAVGTSRRLAPLLKMPPEAILSKIRGAPGSFVWLKRFLPAEEAQRIEKAGFPGVGLQWEHKRSYPNGDLASHLLGFVGSEGKGLSGVELACDAWLTDSRPPRRALRDGKGSRLNVLTDEPEERPGTFVRLTLDRTLQYMAERELEWGMKRSRAKAGLIVVQDPWSGDILAAASRPNLSLAQKRPSAPEALAIPSAHWVFEPGSKFKVVLEGLVRPQETFDCENGAWKHMDITIHDHTREKVLTFAQVMERSSNIGTAKVALKLGREKMYDYVRRFGFGTMSGAEIPGESAGLLKPLSKWSGVTLPVLAFGQEIGVTALQLASAYSALANGGTLYEPRVFREARNQWGETRRWGDAAVRRVISEKTSAEMRKILEGVVQRGTGRDALLNGWSVAGKTGTAQKIDPRTRRYSPEKFVASFCGFVPAARPRLTIVVVYDEPQGVTYGGYNAGPVFRNVAWHAMTYLGVSSDADTKLAKR
jgi:cell division protein FtsI (penicillin-binding protein 3)